MVPQFEEIFSSFGAELPAFTLFVLAISNFVQSYGIFIGIGIGIAGYMFMRAHKKSQSFRDRVDRAVLKIPVIEEELKKLRNNWLELMMPVMEVMVMEEMPVNRQAYAYNRGDYTQPIYEVDANTPEVLPAFSSEYPKNRLGLSKWLFSEDNPLTARVTVNRYWQMLFGTGLVSTPHDFGVQGALPTHPELIDWLAVDFMESGWDVKALLKTMVMSHTYRQSSQVSSEMREKDPNNMYLARSNSYRLPAEMIRDNALAASGLLVQKVGGESVKPYQPGKLWQEKNTFSHKNLPFKKFQCVLYDEPVKN